MRFGAEVVGAVEVRMRKRARLTKVRKILQNSVFVMKVVFWVTKLVDLILNYSSEDQSRREKLHFSDSTR